MRTCRTWTDLAAVDLEDDATRRARRHRQAASGSRCGPNPTPGRSTTPRSSCSSSIPRSASNRRPPTSWGLQGLSTTAGQPIEMSPVFQVYRDNLTTEIDNDRRTPRTDGSRLRGARRRRRRTRRPAARMDVHHRQRGEHDRCDPEDARRDDGSARRFDPRSTRSPRSTRYPENPEIARFIEGTYSVPNYLTGDGAAGSALNVGP